MGAEGRVRLLWSVWFAEGSQARGTSTPRVLGGEGGAALFTPDPPDEQPAGTGFSQGAVGSLAVKPQEQTRSGEGVAVEAESPSHNKAGFLNVYVKIDKLIGLMFLLT